MQSTCRLEEVEIQAVWIDTIGRFEVAAESIIRCRRGADQTAMRSTAWTKEEQELVAHVLRAVLPKGMKVSLEYQGAVYKVHLTPPSRRWVIRRKDGTVYQIHPAHALGFAREKFHELVRQEG
jgi:hypothetical protein